MVINFTKMQGCGNDYIYINCFEKQLDDPNHLATILSDRHYGIGGDGLVLILPSDVADAKMRMFNRDGSESKMCGNAIRCVAKYLYDEHIVRKRQMSIETPSGIKIIDAIIQDGIMKMACVNMGRAILTPADIPVNLPGEHVIGRAVVLDEKEYSITCVSMGNPHTIIFCNDVVDFPVENVGALFESGAWFPEKTNVEFVQIINEWHIKMRVWERGCGETFACGTGACAAAVAAVLNGYCQKNTDIKVELVGGDLLINYTDDAVMMRGDCKKVFDGTVKIKEGGIA